MSSFQVSLHCSNIHSIALHYELIKKKYSEKHKINNSKKNLETEKNLQKLLKFSLVLKDERQPKLLEQLVLTICAPKLPKCYKM